MKYIITESQYNNIIDEFITSQFEPHEEKPYEWNPDVSVWSKNGKIIARNDLSEYFWVIPNIWDLISLMFSLDYDETQEVIHKWLKKHHDIWRLTPERASS